MLCTSSTFPGLDLYDIDPAQHLTTGQVRVEMISIVICLMCGYIKKSFPTSLSDVRN